MSKDLLSDIEYAIAEHMQKTILLCSWADHLEETKQNVPGSRYEDTIPKAISETFRSLAYHLGEQMYRAIKIKWQQETQQVNVEPWGCLIGWAFNNGKLDDIDRLITEWAYFAVMSAVGSGAFWEQDYSPLQVRKADGELVEVEVRGLNFEIPEWEG